MPADLLKKRILSLDLAAVVAGTKYRGEFEERMKKILKELQEDKNIILFIFAGKPCKVTAVFCKKRILCFFLGFICFVWFAVFFIIKNIKKSACNFITQKTAENCIYKGFCPGLSSGSFVECCTHGLPFRPNPFPPILGFSFAE